MVVLVPQKRENKHTCHTVFFLPTRLFIDEAEMTRRKAKQKKSMRSGL